MPSSAVLINNAAAAAAAPFRRRAARSAATHNRGSSLTVRATGKAVWANEDEEDNHMLQALLAEIDRMPTPGADADIVEIGSGASDFLLTQRPSRKTRMLLFLWC